MAQFLDILSPSDIISGQALWKYHISDDKFAQLKNLIADENNIDQLDPRVCTLYFAEWWKRCYDGGTPSKERIFESVGNLHRLNSDQFYKQAIKGGISLKIRWISRLNKLYFRTLLLQGGLPLKHISNNQGAYTIFLSKILELNPKSISDFSNDSTITKLLPIASQNNDIYQCCLDIAKDILEGNQDYFDLLDNNDGLTKMSSALKLKKANLAQGRKRVNIKASWLYEPQKKQIKLNLNIPELSDSGFRIVFNIKDGDFLEAEYKLFYNEKFVGKFIKRQNEIFKFDLMNSKALIWDGADTFPELYLSSANQIKHDCSHFISGLPSFEKPTLWSKYSDNEWIMEKGTHSADEEAFLMVLDNFINDELDIQWEDRIVSSSTIKWAGFNGEIEVTGLKFTTDKKSVDWYIIDEKPSWIHRANFPIVTNRTRIAVYDLDGEVIHNPTLKWRLKNILNHDWQNWQGNWPKGIIEIRIESGDIIEYDEVYCIGNCNVIFQSQTLDQATISFLGDGVSFSITKNPKFDIANGNGNTISLTLTDNTSIPTSIHGTIKVAFQNRSLIFEMYPPFKGLELLDINGRIVLNQGELYLNNLQGLRLMSKDQGNLFATLRNTSQLAIILTQQIGNSYSSLNIFTDKINRLFTLSDSMDGNARVRLSIHRNNIQGNNALLKTYYVKQYTHHITSILDDGAIMPAITVNPQLEDLQLFAIPLDGSISKLEVIELERLDETYSIRQEHEIGKYIIFSEPSAELNVQPTFVNTDLNGPGINPGQRIERIEQFKQHLSAAKYEDEIWSKFLLYYSICLKYQLPFSTFDILRAISCSSELSAKAFIYLTCYDESDKFVGETHKTLEQDIGFYFHWVNKKDWGKAMDWIGCGANPELFLPLSTAIKACFQELLPHTNSDTITNHVLQDTPIQVQNGFLLNNRITALRQSLGVTVQDGLPEDYPSKPPAHNYIIQVNHDNNAVKILLRTPEVIALSISGKSDSLWHPSSEKKRRNLMYCIELAPKWYTDALIYCLSKI